MIREPIHEQFAVSLSEVSVGRLIRRIGFTPQRPMYQAWQQDREAVERWQRESYLEIARRAKRENAMILPTGPGCARTVMPVRPGSRRDAPQWSRQPVLAHCAKDSAYRIS